MRAAVYLRISQDQSGEMLGVERQLEACTALAAQLDWTVAKDDIFDDNDVSAFSGARRSGFEALLEAMKDGRVGAVLCWHTDRLYRSPKDLERFIDVADVAKVQIRTVNSGHLDLSNSAGRMVARILGATARQESEHMAERRKAANLQAALAGKWVTANRCFGYTSDGVPLEPEASAVRQAVADVLAGKSIRRVTMDWNQQGLVGTRGGAWNSPGVRRALINPRIAGRCIHLGVDMGAGDWVPLVDEATHRGLVAFLSDPSRIKCTSFERKYIGSGVYVCGLCGGIMKAARPGGRITYTYICRDHSHVSRSGQPVDDLVTAALLDRLALPGSGLQLDTTPSVTDDLQTQRAALATSFDRLFALVEDGTLDGPGVRQRSAELRAGIAAIDRQLADAASTSPAAGLRAAADADELWELWQGMSPALRGQVVDELMVVTVMPCPRGGVSFDPQFIDIAWKAGL